MRPITRGDAPKDDAGTQIVFAEYREARDPLIERIGDYCSYCEVVLHSTVPVEHVCPKREHGNLEREWTNFLLACDNCNATKGHKGVVLDDYFWPDHDNTARAFAYQTDLAPQVADGLTDDEKAVAKKTLELTGVDREPGHPDLSARDRRWRKRREAWGIALLERKKIGEKDTPQQRESAVTVAISRGFWSVWMQVFHDDVDMRRRLIDWFTGTAKDCFDDEGELIPRPGGRL